MTVVARTASGCERWSADARVARHRHAEAYAALVLSGSYEECGSRGRFRVGPGDVLFHGAFDAHLDRFSRQGAQILNLVLPACRSISFGMGFVADPDAVARAAERDPVAAAEMVRERVMERTHPAPDWPELLAADLLRDPACRLECWAATHRLAPETISRGFGRVFGVTPAAFRAEVRAVRAFYQIAHGSAPLAAIAAHTGFADQAHMSRAIRALTGAAPSAWRRTSIPFKTEYLPAA